MIFRKYFNHLLFSNRNLFRCFLKEPMVWDFRTPTEIEFQVCPTATARLSLNALRGWKKPVYPPNFELSMGWHHSLVETCQTNILVYLRGNKGMPLNRTKAYRYPSDLRAGQEYKLLLLSAADYGRRKIAMWK